jgi:hypothetical protein
VKYPIFALLGIGLVGAGCFNPSIRDGGFACTNTADGQCPDGYYCVNGRCQSNPNPVTQIPSYDFSMAAPAVDMSMPQQMTSKDMAHSAMADMSKPTMTVDMAKPVVPDMTMPVNTCAHKICRSGAALDPSCDPCVNAVCKKDKYCCEVEWDSLCVGDTDTYCSASEQC